MVIFSSTAEKDLPVRYNIRVLSYFWQNVKKVILRYFGIFRLLLFRQLSLPSTYTDAGKYEW